MGAAYLAGIQIGWWTKDDIATGRKIERMFEPQMDEDKRQSLYKKWEEAVRRTMNWSDK